MDSGAYTHLFKVVIIGESGVGKSNLMTRYALDDFHTDSAPTIGVEFLCKTLLIDNRDVKVQIWDTAGQDRFRAISRSIYYGAKGAMVVYDVTSRASFDAIPTWLSELREHVHPNTVTMLIGNKCDLEHMRAVPREMGEALAREHGLSFMETSALDTTNVDSAFETLVREIYNQNRTGGTLPSGAPLPRQRPSGVRLQTTPSTSRGRCCGGSKGAGQE